MRTTNLIVAGFAALLILLVGVAVWWTVVTSSVPEILADLPNEDGPARLEFDRRVRQRFPIGSPQSDLLGYLRTWGFKQVEFVDHGFGGAMELSRSRGNFACSDRWTVAWRADAGVYITAISTRHFVACL